MILPGAILLMATNSVFSETRIVPTPMPINTYVYDILKYDADKLLTYMGKPINKSIVEGILEGSRFKVLSHNKESIRSQKSDFIVDEFTESVLFPGSVITLNTLLGKQKPIDLNLPRKPLSYSTNLPLIVDGNFEIVPTYSVYQNSLNQVLEGWYKTNAGPVARFVWDDAMVYSQDQMRVKYGFGETNKMNIDFEAVENNKLLVKIHRYELLYYSVYADSPPKPSALFEESVTGRDFIAKGINSDNPPLFVNSGFYGRLFYVILSTTSTNDTARDILENGKERQYHQLENFQMRIPFIRGGSEKFKSELRAANDLNSIKSVITKYHNFNQTEPAVLLRYAADFLKDNSHAVINGSAEYLGRTTEKIYEGGVIQLSHQADYKVKLSINWTEIGYDEKGKETLTEKYWDQNNQEKESISEKIELKGNARRINIQAWAYAGHLWWKDWKKVYDKEDLPLVKLRELTFEKGFWNPYVQVSSGSGFRTIHPILGCLFVIFCSMMCFKGIS